MPKTWTRNQLLCQKITKINHNQKILYIILLNFINKKKSGYFTLTNFMIEYKIHILKQKQFNGL